jgi:protein SCO1/2
MFRHNLFTAVAILIALALCASQASAYPEAPDYVTSNSQLLQKAGIDQKLDAPVPLDITFKDSTGATVKLGKYFQPGKPVVLALVYYGCKMLCPMTLDGITKSLKELELSAGKDFNVVIVSFNPEEKPPLAASKKAEYTEEYNRAGATDGWYFLTGDEKDINKLANAVGFRYFYDTRTQQYGHVSAIMILTPDGHVSKYFYGLEYAPEDLRLGLVQASQGHIGSLADAVLLLCCRYDPTTGKYGLVVTRMLSIGGIVTILAIGSLIGFFILRDRKSAVVAGPSPGNSPGSAGDEQLRNGNHSES